MMPRRIRDFLNIFGSSTAAAADNAAEHDESTQQGMLWLFGFHADSGVLRRVCR